MKGEKTMYVCSECGYKNAKWYGKCPSCTAFNTFEEISVISEPQKRSVFSPDSLRQRSAKLDGLSIPEYIRMGSGMSEFDRVLGGGIVSGSAVLISGEPGIGKSTLLMQLCGTIGNKERILYVSGEDAIRATQVRLLSNVTFYFIGS